MCAHHRHADRTVNVATSTNTPFARASKVSSEHRHNADPNAWSAPNAHQRRHASIRNALIRVVVLVAGMHVVKYSITVQSVAASRVKLAIHSVAANLFQLKQSPKMKDLAIHACHHLAVRIHSVAPTPIRHRVNAFLATSDHRQIADQNVLSMPIVRRNMPASIINASIHVLARAAPMPNVMSLVTQCPAFVHLHTLEIHSCSASSDKLNRSIRANHHHAARMPSARNATALAHADASKIIAEIRTKDAVPNAYWVQTVWPIVLVSETNAKIRVRAFAAWMPNAQRWIMCQLVSASADTPVIHLHRVNRNATNQ